MSISKSLIIGALLLMFFQTAAFSASEKEDASSLADVNTKGLEKNESKYKWGSNPFYIPGSQKKEGGVKIDGMTLNGVIYKKGGGVAIINNKILRKGDTVAGKKIIEILQDKVILAEGDERIELIVEKFSSAP